MNGSSSGVRERVDVAGDLEYRIVGCGGIVVVTLRPGEGLLAEPGGLLYRRGGVGWSLASTPDGLGAKRERPPISACLDRHRGGLARARHMPPSAEGRSRAISPWREGCRHTADDRVPRTLRRRLQQEPAIGFQSCSRGRDYPQRHAYWPNENVPSTSRNGMRSTPTPNARYTDFRRSRATSSGPKDAGTRIGPTRRWGSGNGVL